MKYINMYYATKGGYVSGSERFDSAAEAAAKGSQSPNFALVLPYVPKAERLGVTVSTQRSASVKFNLSDFVRLVQEQGTHKVVTTDGEAVKVLDIEDTDHVILKITDEYNNVTLDFIDLEEDDETMVMGAELLIVRI